MKHLLVYFCLCVLSGSSIERKLPPYVNVCKRYDPEISKCWEKTVKELRPYLTKGIPEFDVPPLTTFRVEKIHLDQQNTRNINFVADLYNLTFTGAENFEVLHTDADFRALNLNEILLFPKLTMKGQYTAKGRVLLFEFQGEGEVEGEFDNVNANGTWYFRLYNKKGKEHMTIDHDDLDLNVGKIYLYLHDLFRGNPEISANVNKAINDNSDILLQDFKPLLHTTLSAILNSYFNRVYALFPFNVLLPED